MEKYFIHITDPYDFNLLMVRKKIKHIVGEHIIDE
jgi:hypothetical protein